LAGIEGERFLTENVFAVTHTEKRVLRMKCVGSADIDCIYLGVFDQLLIIAIGPENFEIGSKTRSTVQVARPDGNELGSFDEP
jgi:hypothetical protein